ncbi:hypothetical protein HAX54_022170, partial [Datura stramonium]|nr:hypothetical protein [Datura stramonium]
MGQVTFSLLDYESQVQYLVRATFELIWGFDMTFQSIGFLKGMTQAGILPSTLDGSQTKVGGQTLDQQTTS